MGIYSGLTKIPVYRLKQSWAKLPKKSTESFSRFETLFSCEKNFSNYRTKLAAASLPKIPFLGFLLSDLMFIEQGNKDTVKIQNEFGDPTELINVEKWRKVGGVLYDIIQMQAVNYQYSFDANLEKYCCYHTHPHTWRCHSLFLLEYLRCFVFLLLRVDDLEAALQCLTGKKTNTTLDDNQQMELSCQLEEE